MEKMKNESKKADAAIPDEKTVRKDLQLEKGRLYHYNGAELVIVEPSDVLKVPITDEAMDAVKDMRKEAHKLMKVRPELMVVASAMLKAAAQVPDMAQLVKQFAKSFYND